jgi:acetyl-CoA carboxylase, biotin carboxylase subunit
MFPDAFYKPQRIRTLLVANRGEIAVRVIRAAQELGMRAAVTVSDADRDSLAARMADQAVPIGSAHAAKSYLNPDAILEAARQCGADAIHPGYGFLSENAAFAEKVETAGLIFVGPSSAIIAMMGDKARARATAQRAGVPTVPGSEGVLDSLEQADAAFAWRTMRRSSMSNYPSRNVRPSRRSVTPASIWSAL